MLNTPKSTLAAVSKEYNVQKESRLKQLQRECVRAMGLVTRMVNPEAREVRENRKAMDAMHAEMDQLQASNCFSFDEVEEWSDVTQRDPTARWVSCMMLLGLKNVEREPQFQKWKGRLVALGN